MTRRRRILIALGGLTAVVAMVVVAVHSRSVQRQVFDRITGVIEQRTGISVRFGEAGFRLWPARLTADEIEVTIDDVTLANVERIEARWRWTAVMREPRRIDELVLEGVDIDLTDMPPMPERDIDVAAPTVDPFSVLEIGRFEVRGNGGTGAATDFVVILDGLAVKGRLEDGVAAARLRAASLVVTRSGRPMDLGELGIEGTVNTDGVKIEKAFVNGASGRVDLQGAVTFDDTPEGAATLRLAGDTAAMVEWWDPNIASGVDPAGVIEADGEIALADGRLSVDLVHRGSALRLAGYDLDELELHVDGGTAEARLAGASWGVVEVSVAPENLATVTASLQQAPLERLVAMAAPQAASVLGSPMTVTGDLAGTVSYPFALETLSGDVDLRLSSPRGRAAVALYGEGRDWELTRAQVETAGLVATGHGEIHGGNLVGVEADLRIDDVASVRRQLADLLTDIELPEVGGALVGRFDADGPVSRPTVAGEIEWRTPSVAGVVLDSIRLEGRGGRERVEWSAAAFDDGVRAEADGVYVAAGTALGGSWSFTADHLRRVGELFPAWAAGLSGSLDGAGDFSLEEGLWTCTGRVEGREVRFEGWTSERIAASFRAGPGGLEVDTLEIAALGGTISGSAAVGFGGLDAEVAADLGWRGLELARAPVDFHGADPGVSQGQLEVGGTLNRPSAMVEVDWAPTDEFSAVPPLRMAAALVDGVVTLVSEEVESGGGALWMDGELPLGAVPVPYWLWPDAPDGEVRLTVHGKGLDSDVFTELLGLEPQPVRATADLEFEAVVDPGNLAGSKAYAELRDLELEHPGGRASADGPVVLTVADGRLELASVRLSGPQTHVLMSGKADLRSRTIEGEVDAVLAPGISRLVPYPVQIHEPIRISAALGGTIDQPKADLTVSHPGGAIVVRDPALQILGLELSAEVADGSIWINDGRAQVNQGSVEIGGGWDPVSGQGIVAELENVVFFVEGILTQWTGTVAVEPRSGAIARVVGELNLVGGLWDEHVDLGWALFGGDTLDPSSEDPLDDITLDLDVRGRGTVRVDNNLGRFDARWDVIRATGTVARPRLNGEIDIAPGGTFSLAGQQVTVRRGSLLFTGDPDSDPIVEIVPESDFGVFGGEEGQINTTAIAAQSLVGGLAGALGFENETLQPSEISVEVEKDTADQFMLGQRLTHNVALFFATSTKDVQDRTSMLQLWNLPRLEGLSLQAYEKTLTEETGFNLIQRFHWGGASVYEDRPTIRKLSLDGEWPLKKRRLKRATGLRRGQPYDPFLPFVARVRMERQLAAAGFQEARIRVEAVESGNAWTLHFEAEPGDRREVVFDGDLPSKQIRNEVTALYQHPPLEDHSLRNMRALLDRHFDARGYPSAVIEVERRGDVVVAEATKGELVELSGPVLKGVPEPLAEAVARRLGSAAELASLSSDSEHAERMIEKVLADQGYRDARVSEVETVTTGAESAEVRAVVELGPPAVVGEVVVTGTDPLGLVESDEFPLRAGTILDRLAVDLAASRLRAGYDAAGYSDAVIRGSADEAANGRWIVALDIEPGIRRTLEDVEVTGLKHTSPRAIKAGMTVEVGEILKNSDLDTTAMRVANFAPIERVEVRTVPQGATGAKVELDVIEKKRWTTEVGGGWSSERGAQARFGLRDDNLFGRGFNLNLRGRWDQTEWLGFVVASLPPLPGKRISFTSTVGFSRGEAPRNPDLLDQDETFWSVEGTRWMGRGDLAAGTAGEQVTVYYQFNRTRFYGLDDSGFIPVEIDTTIDTGLIGARYVNDRFDSPFDPTSGYGVVVDAGTSREFLGSDFDYWTALATGSLARRAPWSSTWIQSLRLGVAEPLHGQSLIDTAKFLAGGQGSIRGFDRNSVGPTEFGIDGPVPAGGGALFVLNEELRIPIRGGFRAALFADVGQVWERWGVADWKLAVGAGVGIRWSTPIGPLWADVAWPVANRGISSTKPKFYIGIGRPF